MRISAESDSVEYWRRYFLDDLVVKLDGAEQKECKLADDVEGYVIVLVLDEQGRPVIEGDEFKTCRKSGKVEFIGERRVL